MKLYKFRAIDEASFKNTKAILETGMFWCASFWSLNDPMEGIFSDPNDEICGKRLDDLLRMKSQTGICSFSGEAGFHDPLMWGYYANGFKGLAVEVEIENCKEIEDVTYEQSIHCLAGSEVLVEKILTTKLEHWAHENEFRYLNNSDSECLIKIGEITAIYFGNPYRDVQNRESIMAISDSLRCYACHVKQLKETAERRGYDVYEAWPDHEGRVQISQRFKTQ